jgi:uncharacterized protein
MEYEWDQDKADRNRPKRGIVFADAVTIFQDDSALTVDDRHHEEERFRTIGMDAIGRILVVAYTRRGDLICLISVRKASPRERKQYEGKGT